MAYNLKDPEEVKEYIKNLGIEYRFSCYHENKPDGCHLLGDYLEAISKDYEKAAAVYKQNCELNKYGHSCFKYGSYLHLGKGIAEDFEQSLNYFKLGCDLSHPKSCLLSGTVIANRHKDFKLAMKYLEKGCEGKCADSCNLSSTFYITGKPGLEKDMSKALQLGIKGCELGHLHSCVNVSQMYARGEGTSKNEELAAKYKNIALDVQDQQQKFQQIKMGET